MVQISTNLISTIAAIAVTSCLVHADGRDSGDTGSSGWTIVASYTLPEGASGLAWDGTNLYCGIYGANGDKIYRIDPATGSYALLFSGVHGDAFGLTWDGSHLWTTDHPGGSSTPAIAMKLDWDGSVIDQFDLPDHYMSGIAWDSGDFWVSRYYPDPGHLYRVDDAGSVLDQFDGPDDQPWDLAIENDSLWIADYWGDALYRVDPISGNMLESHPSEGIDPAGIVWDGQYLWYCDNGDNFSEDLLYKVDLQGGGSPEIVIGTPTHAFGNIAIGNIATWNVEVQNTGTSNLVISDVDFNPDADLTCTTMFPVVIPAGESTQLPIEYEPTSFGPLDAIATVLSNDPIHPGEELVITGHGVYTDATIAVADPAHTFGQVRLGAHTRWFIDVTNQGEQALVISGATSDEASFYLDPDIEYPLILDTLESALIGVWFNPSSTETTMATISISSNDADMNPAQVAVSGAGMDAESPMGTGLWSYLIDVSWDNTPKAMAPISDVSGDGRSDVVVCSEDYFVRCFNGNAHGTGDVLWEHEIYSGPVYSDKGLDVVQDIDGDGFDDFVIGTTGGARLIRMLSGKTGNTIWTYHTNQVGDGGWVYQVDGSQDFTGDGVADVLACAGDDGKDTGPKRAYCLNGLDGTLVWQRPLNGPVFAIIAVDDFTGDGTPDAVAGASNEMETQGRAVGINGATGVEEWSFQTGGSSVWSLAQVGDISLDGINDVMIGDFTSGQFHALDAFDGSQLFSGGGLGLLTGFQRIEDVNGDGHPEIVPEYFHDYVRLISGADGSVIWSTPVADNPTVVSAIPDVSGDGINDLVVGTLFNDNYTYFLDGVDGTILHSANFGTPVDSIAVIPDVVGDGSWELLAGGRNGKVACLSGGVEAMVFDPADVNEDGVVNVNDLLMVIAHWGMIDSPADVNEDGIVDVDDLLMVISAWNPDP
jgi:hypothetical protein|tara:strand:+ start:24 stop:2819 length:2796 start_codon:yes stop_codon:yes gene_type:complete